MSECDINKDLLCNYFLDMLSSIPLANHIKIHKCYNVTVDSNWHIDNRKKSDLFIVIILSGNGSYVFNDKTILMEKGKVIFISNNLTHSVKIDKKNPPSFISIHFGLYDKKRTLINKIKTPFSFSFIPNNTVKFINLFQSSYNYSNESNHLLKQGIENSVMTELLYSSIKECTEETLKTNKTDKRIQNLKEYMDKHPLDNTKINDFAKKLSLSRKHLSFLFKKCYGLTPKEYQIKVKINYARLLLEDTSISVKEVAHTIGYPDPYAFSKQFKKVLGISPSKVKL